MDQRDLYETVDGIVQFDEWESIEEVTPDTAMAWIAASWGKNGRQFYPTQLEKIQRYAKLMRENKWEHDIQHSRIELKDGVVTGGKHRLHAVLLSGKSIWTRVLRKNRRLKETQNGS